ncbi:SurA N-terminal domain-containing protein [Peterkaempfera bronchialis]|uniref:SurA N-terminal domain-containing protein n=1 Tax=Peterkaempfera bronchialis TaxID=2126346 RepID=UPI000DBC3A88|nr:SurA N-terminal domain-containing protein [Peterkaempfera bronchialis]
MIRIPVPDRTAAPVRRRAIAAAGAVLATVALTACGNTARPGSAAVVGDHRITTSAVQAQVVAYRDAVAEESQGIPQPENAGLARNTVREMILSDLVAHALTQQGLTVTPGEIQQARAADARQLGGEAGLRRALLEQKGVAPNAADDFYRRILGMQKLAQHSGEDPDTQQGTEAIRKALIESSGSIKVELNPRYGSWDPKTISFSEGGDDWLHAPRTEPS